MTTFASPLPADTQSVTSFNLRQSSPASSSNDFETFARQQATEFEANFLSALLRPVFEGLAKDATFGGGFAEETWTGLLTEEYARGIAGTSSLGIADEVYRQIMSVENAGDSIPALSGQTSSTPTSLFED